MSFDAAAARWRRVMFPDSLKLEAIIASQLSKSSRQRTTQVYQYMELLLPVVLLPPRHCLHDTDDLKLGCGASFFQVAADLCQ